MQLDAEEEGAAFGATSPPAGIKATDFPGENNGSRPTTAQSEDTQHEVDDRPASAGSSQ